MKNLKRKKRGGWIAALGMMPSLVGCIQSGGAVNPDTTSMNTGTSGSNYSSYLSGSGSGSSSGGVVKVTPTPTPAESSGRGSLPPQTFNISGVGYTQTTPISITVSARKILKLRFSPGIQMEKIAGTGFSPLYNGLGVYITVGDDSRPTPLLSNGVLGGLRQQSAIMDFSAKIPSGGGDVTITISKPNYDYYCLHGMGGCPWDRVHPNHPWNGDVFVETDDTQALK